MNALHRNFAIVVFAVLLTACPSLAVAAEPVQLRVLSYNIHHGVGVDGKLDLRRTAMVIRSVSPDVVALQEVDQRVERSEKIDQPAELAKLTGMNVVFGKNIDLQGGAYGNAVLSKFPITHSQNLRLPRVQLGERRGVLIVEFQPPQLMSPIRLLATHFDHRPDDAERILSAERIADWVSSKSELPALLAGDLNATPDSQVLQQVLGQWTMANRQPLPTFPARKSTRQLDYILFRPASRWRTVSVRVLDEQIASDHRPILAVLELIPSSDGT